jgi:uncharacterized protein YecE (DUF72 family)
MRLYVGCAMWTHRPWQGRLLPHPLPAGERLSAYASWCNAVEGNTTFYATPSRATAASWADQAGPDFRLLAKLPKTVTHEHRLTGADEELRAFLDAIEPLGPRADVLWLQLPATFTPADVPVLERFLRRLPTSHRYAVEVRHRAFFDDPRAGRQLEEALSGTASEWVPFDTTVLFQTPPTSDAEREAWTRKPRMPRRDIALTDRPIVRYIGRDATDQTVEGWQHWVAVVAGWLREGRTPTMFIHTPDNAEALPLARRFHDDVRGRVPGLEPLPEPIAAEQPTLF